MTAWRLRLAACAAVLLAVIAWVALRRGREPRWTVVLEAEQDAVTPWREVRLTAHVEPAAATTMAEPWRWSWQVDSAALPGHEPRATWRSGDLGEHAITVMAESPWGTRRRASVGVVVRLVAFDSPIAGRVEPTPAPATAKELPFEIADVWVEKDKVCQGEPSRIRVTARDKRGEERWLTPIIDGKVGWEVPFITPPSPPGERMVQVSLTDPRMRDGATVNTSVFIEVADCIAPFPIFVEERTVPPDENYIAFAATMFDGPAWQARAKPGGGGPSPLATAALYRWSFGDGGSTVGTSASVRHRYPPEADRPDERASSYAVKVEALDANGATMATGYAAVELANRLRALKREQGLVQLATEQAPGSQEGADGSRFADVTLTNIDRAETANLARLTLRFKSCDGAGAPGTERDVGEVFSERSIPPRGHIRGRLALSSSDLAGVCWVDASVSGTSEPGEFKVVGFFALDTGRSNGVPLDPSAQATMSQALDLLGDSGRKEGTIVVTDDQIRRLEDEGKIPLGVLRPDPMAARGSH